MTLGLKIIIDGIEKDLDDIFLKIEDYNSSVDAGERTSGEGVILTKNTGIKYFENGIKKDLIERYIGYDIEGYIEANYEDDINRINNSEMTAIKDICNNNLVDLFYQLGTKKKTNNILQISNGLYIISLYSSTGNYIINYTIEIYNVPSTNFPSGTQLRLEINSTNTFYIKKFENNNYYLQATSNNLNLYNLGSLFIKLISSSRSYNNISPNNSNYFIKSGSANYILKKSDNLVTRICEII